MNFFLKQKMSSLKEGISVLILFFAYGNLAAENITIIQNPSRIYRVGEEVRLSLEMETEKEPLQFMFSKMEGPAIEKIKWINSKINVVSKTMGKKPVLTYRFDFLFKAAERGTASIGPVQFTFMNAKGDKQNFSSGKLQFEVVSWYKRYRLQLVSLFLFSLATVFFLFVKKSLLKARKKREAIQKIIQFKQIKIEKEKESREKLKMLSQYLIAGDYSRYASGIIDSLAHYFNGCLQLPLSLSQAEMKVELLKKLPPVFHHKINQIFEMLEFIQFTNQKPQPADLERVQVLAKELIAQHREKGEEIS
jgi:hypothetical protein